MKTKMKYAASMIIMMALTIGLYAQPQPGDCYSENNSYRSNKNVWIIEPQYTPFDAGQVERYKGLDYFDVDCEYVVNGTLTVNKSEVNVATTNGGSIRLWQYGTIAFRYNGREYQMVVYQNIDMPEFKRSPGTYFIAFKDATNGSGDPNIETWKDGRYLIIDIPAQGNKVSVDFNLATNPYEAYSGKSSYTTLVISGGNVLEAPLAAGERKYEDRTR